MADASLLARIQKLLKLAADRSTTPEEAALAAERAQALLYKHNLTLADVQGADDIVEVDRISRNDHWRLVLGANLAKYNRCRMLHYTGGMRFIGKPGDIEIVLYLYTYLSRMLQRMSHEAWTAHVKSLTDPILGVYPSLLDPEVETNWVASWRIGAVQMIAIRLERQAKDEAARRDFERRALVGGTTKDALVQISDALVKWDATLVRYIEQKYGQTRVEEFDVHIHHDAFVGGVLTGKGVGLHRGLKAGTPWKKLGN